MNLRFVERLVNQMPHPNPNVWASMIKIKVLQQQWTEIYNGEVEWRDVPLIDLTKQGDTPDTQDSVRRLPGTLT